MLKNFLLYVVVPIVVLLLIFALQNMAEVDLAFLFWTFRLSRVVFLMIFFVAGMAVGASLIGAWVLSRRGRDRGGERP